MGFSSSRTPWDYSAAGGALVSWCWAAVVMIVLVIAARLNCSGLGHYDPFYDSGVYLESARMIRHGYAAYERVFSSQPPLWLPLLRLSFFFFGESFLAGQLVVVAAGLIILAAVMATVAHLQGRGSALLAALFIMLAPTQLIWSRAVIAEAPSMAFAATALAMAARYHYSRRRLWVVLASIAITSSILTKLFGVYTVPAIVLLVIARWMKAPGSRHARRAGVAGDLAIMLITAAGVVLAFAAVTDPLRVWDQAVQFHLSAQVSDASNSGAWRNVFQYWRSDGVLWAIAPFSVLCILGGWPGLAVFIWVLSTLIGLLQHQPVFPHHLVVLVPPLAAAAAIGWAQLVRWPLQWWYRAETLPKRVLAVAGGAVCVALGLLMTATLISQAHADRLIRRWAASETKAARADKMAAIQLRRFTQPGDIVLTDAQGVAFLADRDVPPGLTDTSFKRIAARYLEAREVIDESERFHVSAVLLWTGRLSRMPEIVDWVMRRFPQHQSFGHGRELYLRTLPSGSD